MKKSNGSKVVLIRRTGASPKADNTIGMYKRDGKGAYTTDEDHDCAEIHPDANHKQWAKKNIRTEEDDVQMTATQKASDDAEKRRAADAKKRDAIQAARERLQQSTKAARERLQQAKAAKVEEYDVTDESSVKDIVGQALQARTRRKEGERKAKAYQDSVKAKAKERDTAGRIRATLKGTAWGRRPLRNGDDEYDATDESIVSPKPKPKPETRDPKWPVLPKPKHTRKPKRAPVRYAQDEEIEENQDNKEAKRKAEHSALVARLIAARGTKPKKGPYKPHPKTTVHKIKYGAPHDPKYGPGGRYDTLTGKREEVEFNEWTSAKDRGEPQSPRSEDEYNALSPEHKKLIDARIAKARATKPEGRPRVKGKTPGRSVRENLAYSKPDKKGHTFHVAKRKKPGDKVSMSVRDSQGNVVKDHGSHVNVKGAKKFATSRGYDMGEGRPWGREVGAEWDEPDGPDYSSRRRKAPRKPPPAPPKEYEKKHPLSQKDRAAIRNKLGRKKYPQSEEVTWEEAQYWSEDTVADFLKRGGKITKLNPRVARGATKKQTIRLRGSTKSTADRGRKAEKKVHGEEVEEIDEGGMGNNPPKKRPMSDAQKERRAKHQKLLKITGAKRSKAPRKKARGKTEISKIAGRYEEIEEYAPPIEEAVSVDGRTRDYRGTRTRLEAKGRRRGEGLDGRTKGYRDARTRITARQQRAATDAAMMEPEAATTEIEEMQSGSKQSKVEKTGTHSSNLSYVSKSPHAVGRSAKKEKKRASKEARQARKQNVNNESSVSITPEREAEIRKKVRADIEKDRQAKKARDKKDGRYMDHWGNWRTKGKPNPADELTRDFNKESIDKEELKRLMHKKDLDNRHRRREDKAAQRTAKTKRSFGPKGKKPEGTMKIAFRKALEKKQHG